MKTTCPYCGNNPVPHHFYWFSESLNIFLTPPRQKLLYNPVSHFFKSGVWSGKIENFFLNLGMLLGAVTLRRDVTLCKVRRAQVLWEEAEKRGIEMSELLLFGRPVDTYVAERSEIGKLGNWEIRVKPTFRIIFSGLPRPAGYSNRWLDLMDDKWLLKKEFLKHGLPVPKGGSVSNFSGALKIFKRIQKPIIVKPRAGSRGRHSTTFVFNENDLKKAFKISKQLCFWIIVEEQLFGPVYRATVINGHLAGVLRGDPPFVTGDGSSSIAELVGIKNQQPHSGVKDIVLDAGMERFLSRQMQEDGPLARGPSSFVPRAGELISLTEKIGVNYGGSSSEDFAICHPDNKELFVRAAEVLGDPIVGFDFIIQDITKSWREQKCGFIEVNSLPFINLHHDPLLGNPRNTAALVWDMLGW